MRIWCLHPQYLDRQGLLPCWRETLLAQKVLQGQTKGYRYHPQLIRFQSCPTPLAAIGSYLEALADEGQRRGYHFDRDKILPLRMIGKLKVTHGQVCFEWEHLRSRLVLRSPLHLVQFSGVTFPIVHPLFEVVDGNVETWERIA